MYKTENDLKYLSTFTAMLAIVSVLFMAYLLVKTFTQIKNEVSEAIHEIKEEKSKINIDSLLYEIEVRDSVIYQLYEQNKDLKQWTK